eukprot:16426281-Heterocapsa_arctica.AAC.1
MMRGAGHHSLLASGQAAEVLGEMSCAITVSGLMLWAAVAMTLGLRGLPSLAGAVPRLLAVARDGAAAFPAHSLQAAGE